MKVQVFHQPEPGEWEPESVEVEPQVDGPFLDLERDGSPWLTIPLADVLDATATAMRDDEKGSSR